MVGGGPGSFIGHVHFMAAIMDGQIDLVCGSFSSNPEKSRITGAEYYLPAERVYDTYQEMITEEAKLPPGERMDFVCIVTPNHLHFEPAKLAMENGFHVVCDKPLALNVNEAEELVRIKEETGMLFALTHTYTGYPMVKEARKLVQDGKLGKIRKVVVEYPQGWLSEALEKTDHVQASWRGDPDRSGKTCCVGDIGTHAFQLAEYVSGLKTKSLMSDLSTQVPGRLLEDDANMLLQFEGGARGVLYASQISDFYDNLELARISIFKSDAVRSLLFIVASGIALWAFSAKKISKGLVIAIIGVLILVDMWTVNKRYLDNEDFVRESKIENPYSASDADKLILKDKDPNFRVLNLTVDPFADASTSYYHKSIGGYHGAKLRRYQELYDHQLKGKFNRDVLNMLNTKYIIQANEDKKPMVVPNPSALGNAWFVSTIRFVPNADEELEALSNFDPAKTAIIDERFRDDLKGFEATADSTAQIKLIEYAPNDLKYQSNAQKDGFAVFSEIYYPKGWNAYVDGKKTPHVRVNFVLRGMVIPAGKHMVEFKFEPKVFKVGEKISFASSLLLILVIVGYGVMAIRKYIKEEK